MNNLARCTAMACLSLAYSHAQPANTVQKGTTVTNLVNGPFDVKITPQSMDDKSEAAPLGRLSIDKQYHGDLEATAIGEMLTAGSAAKGSAGYVAIERVRGKLNGRSGTFVLQHNAIMNRGTPQLNIVVVPDSGTGQLVGIAGKMNINIVDGKHFYEFEYTLAPTLR